MKQRVKKIGIQVNDQSKVIVYFEADVPGYECTLIEFSIILSSKELYRGNKAFFKLGLKERENLIADARDLLSI